MVFDIVLDVSGGCDGAVCMWAFGETEAQAVYRISPSPRVTNVVCYNFVFLHSLSLFCFQIAGMS